MRTLLLIRRCSPHILLLVLCFTCISPLCGQSAERSSLSPSFAAIIVSDLDSSLVWYQEVLGFSIENKRNLPERGFAQANLSNGKMLLELIQLETAIKPAEALPEYSSKTRIEGLFKIGFAVADFEQWLDHFQKVEAHFHGTVVHDPATNLRMLIILDPDGNRIQLFEQAP